MTPMALERTPGEAAVARSVDTARLIRCSVRCFWDGAIGAIPVIGLGLAAQALRLHERVRRETGATWRRPALFWYWIIGFGFTVAFDRLFGVAGMFSIFGIFLGLQSCEVWRSFSGAEQSFWNPGARHLRWGVVLAYAGYSGSMSLIGMMALGFAGIAFQSL